MANTRMTCAFLLNNSISVISLCRFPFNKKYLLKMDSVTTRHVGIQFFGVGVSANTGFKASNVPFLESTSVIP